MIAQEEDGLIEGQQATKKIKLNPNALTSLKQHSVVVADSGKIQELVKYNAQDATTNPSLILEAAKLPEYNQILENAVQKGIEDFKKIQTKFEEKHGINKRPQRTVQAKKQKKNEQHQVEEVPPSEIEPFNFDKLSPEYQKILLSRIVDQCCVNFGVEILKYVPGYVSTEVDARLSFDKLATIERARQIIALYQESGIDKDRVLIKIATTWEGIEAAKVLKKEKIQCNLTLIFNYYQAIACAQAQVLLISPFVGRILDWFKKNKPTEDYSGINDPGVKLVTRIWSYFKKFKHETLVMAASFRTMEEVENLAGCDKVTVPLSILEQLQSLEGKTIEKNLNQQVIDNFPEEKVIIDEKSYRWQMAVDPMANEKLAEGIKKFADDTEKLEQIIIQKIHQLQR